MVEKQEIVSGIAEAVKSAERKEKGKKRFALPIAIVVILVLAGAFLLLTQIPIIPPSSCENGVLDAGEQGIDCGGVCPAACPSVQPDDPAYVLPVSISDIAIDHGSGNVYVLDEMRHRIILYDSLFNYIKNFGETLVQTPDGGWTAESGGVTDDKLLFPASIAIANGKVYVLDRVPRIQVFSKDLVFEKTLGFSADAIQALPKLPDPPNADGGAASIAVSSDGKIFVADEVSNAICVFDSSLKLLKSVSGSSQNALNIPRQIALSGESLFVADSGNGRIQVFDSGLNLVKSISAGLSMPVGIAVAADGKILVFDNADSKLKQLDQQGSLIKEVGGLGRGELQFYNARALKLDSEGNIFVVEEGNNRIQVLNNSLGFEKMVAGIEQQFSVSFAPFYPAISPKADIAFSDPMNNKVFVLDSKYNLKKTIGGKGFGNSQFNTPKGLAFGPDGKLYVSDSGNRRVQVFSPEYGYLSTITDSELIWPLAISVSEQGEIFVVDDKYKKVLIFNQQGNKTGEIGEGQGITLPLGVLAQGGKVYITDDKEATIEIFDSGLQKLKTISGIDEAVGVNVEFNESLALDNAGRLLFCDNRNRKVVAVDIETEKFSSFGSFGSSLQELSILEVASSGSLIAVTDMEQHRVKFFNASGQEIKEITISDLS